MQILKVLKCLIDVAGDTRKPAVQPEGVRLHSAPVG